MQTEQLFCWSGMTDTEHTTSGSNKENLQLVTAPLINSKFENNTLLIKLLKVKQNSR